MRAAGVQGGIVAAADEKEVGGDGEGGGGGDGAGARAGAGAGAGGWWTEEVGGWVGGGITSCCSLLVQKSKQKRCRRSPASATGIRYSCVRFFNASVARPRPLVQML